MQSRCSTSYGACAETATPDSTNRPPAQMPTDVQHPRPRYLQRHSRPPGANVDEKDRARFLTLRRRKLQRFEDIVDDLQDLVTDGSPTSRELEDREKIIEEFREEARRLSASFAGGAPSVFVEEKAPETIWESWNTSSTWRGRKRWRCRVRSTRKSAPRRQLHRSRCEARGGGGSAGTVVKELLELQQTQMRKQDDAMDKLDGLVGKLKMTSNMIKDEVDLQAKMVEDLDKDFTHTQNRMKKLRKQGFKLSGEKNAEAKEEYEKKRLCRRCRRTCRAIRGRWRRRKRRITASSC